MIRKKQMNLRKIDALIAEHVFGLENVRFDKKCISRDPGYPVQYQELDLYEEGLFYDANRDSFGRPSMRRVPEYSTHISLAWEIVEKLPDLLRTRYLNKLWPESRNAWAVFDFPDDYYVVAETAPLTICLAALKSKGIKYE